MRRSARTICSLALSAALLGPFHLSPASASPTADPRPAPRISPRVAAAAIDADGTVLRRDGSVTVERVRVPASVRDPDTPETLFRVTVTGRYPPRALRYTVLAGGSPIGYGIPSRTGRSVSVLTSDAAVLEAQISVRYGDRAAGPAASGRGDPNAGPAPSAGDLDDPGAHGPYEVTRVEYSFGNKAFQPTDIPGKVELTADVHHPTDLSGGPFPLVVFMHGNHWSCYKGAKVDYTWPCRHGWSPLPNYAGYDYIARRLASQGYVVVSISANGVNVLGNYTYDTGMRQRGEVLEAHLDLWQQWSTVGGDPFGTGFVGKVDMTKIGTMGHSRGGEGVVWNEIVDRERATPYGIDAVLALAPVDFTRVTINEVPFSVVLPYCDGDVYDLQGIHFFDDSRYLVPGDATPKTTVTAFRANHNFFNTVWTPGHGYPGGFDDGQWSGCRNRLTQKEQRRVGLAYIAGFFRRYLGDETDLEPMWTGEAMPASILPATTLVSYLAPDVDGMRLDLSRFADPSDLSVGEGGSVITVGGLSAYGWCADTWEIPCVPNYPYYDVHLPGLGQAVVGWSGHDGFVEFEIPAADADVSGFDALQFRAATNPGYWVNYGYQDLSVVLVDGDGDRASVAASTVGNRALKYPLGRYDYGGHFILNQVRFPLSGFVGVDLDDIASVRLEFDRSFAGVVDVADVAFASGQD